MQQSTSHSATPRIHVGIIMDGNGRWATRQGRSRAAGHRAGAAMVRRIVEAAPDAGIGVLTLFAFSADNWRRPRTGGRLAHAALPRVSARSRPRAASPTVCGWRSSAGATGSAPRSAGRDRGRAAARPRHGTRLHLRIALDYSSRDAILRAAQCLRPETVPVARVVRAAARHRGPRLPVPEVDLLIRTGGERRLSDFLLWEAAYAELLFSPLMWPEFGPEALQEAVRDFAGAAAALRRAAGRGGGLIRCRRGPGRGSCCSARRSPLGVIGDALFRLVPARLDVALGLGHAGAGARGAGAGGRRAGCLARSRRSGSHWRSSASR